MELKAGEALLGLGESEQRDCSIRLNFGKIDRNDRAFASMNRRIAAWLKPVGDSMRWAR